MQRLAAPAVALAFVTAAAIAITTAASPASSVTPRERASTYKGMTARQWATAAHGWMRTAQRHAAARHQLQHSVQQLRKIKAPEPRDVAYAIRLAATAYGVSETQMHRVASCESGHYALAANGQYRGVFQEGPMFERGPFGQAGFSVWDPVANAMTAAWTVAREGWRQWACSP